MLSKVLHMCSVECWSLCVFFQAAAGGALVDVCCLLGSSGGLCVAAAGKWAVCLWTQTSASDWSLRHTWTFSEASYCVLSVSQAPQRNTVGPIMSKSSMTCSCNAKRL